MGYTHLVSEDDRKVSAQLGALMHAKKEESSPVMDAIGPKNKKGQVSNLPHAVGF